MQRAGEGYLSVVHVPTTDRFVTGDATVFPGGYVWVQDRIQHKALMGRVVPDLDPLRGALRDWRGIRHPSFLKLLRLEPHARGALAIFQSPGQAVPLSATSANSLSVESIVTIARRITWAFAFLCHGRYEPPVIDLDHFIWNPERGLFMLGAELSRRNRPEWTRRDHLPFDLMLAPPEWRASLRLTEHGWVYLAASMLRTFLCGHGRSASPTQSVRRLRKGWDSLLEEMTHENPAQRPGFKLVLQRIDELDPTKRSAPELALIPLQDQRVVDRLVGATANPSRAPTAYQLESHPGCEVIHRTTPLVESLRTDGFLVLHSWAPAERGIPYRAVNELIAQIDAVLRQLGEDNLACELGALSEWQDANQLLEKWHPLAERMVKVLISKAFKGILILVEDAHHLDDLAIEALISLAHWVKRDPVAFVFTSPSIACAQLRDLHARWPTTMERVIPSLEPELRARVVWSPERDTADLTPNRRETTWLDEITRLGQSNRKPHIQVIWDDLKAREQLVVKLLSCSDRPLTTQDMACAVALRDIERELGFLTEIQLVAQVDQGYVLADMDLSRFCEQSLSADETRYVCLRLLDHEQQLPEPDGVQLVALSLALNHTTSARDNAIRVLDGAIENWDTERVLRLDRVIARHRADELVQVRHWCDTMTGRQLDLPTPKSPLLRAVRKAWRKTRADAFRAAIDAWLAVARMRPASVSLRAFALSRAALVAAEQTDGLRIATIAREFAALDLDAIPLEAVVIWRSCLAEALLRTAQRDHAMVSDMLNCGGPEQMWIRSVADFTDQRFTSCASRFAYLRDFIENQRDIYRKARMHHLFGHAMYRSDRPGAAIQRYHDAMSEYTRMGHDGAIFRMRFNLGSAYKLDGSFHDALEHLHPLMRDVEACEDHQTHCEILYIFSVISLMQFDSDRYLQLAGEHDRLIGRTHLRQERLRWLILRLHAAPYLAAEDIVQAISDLEGKLNRWNTFQLMRQEAAFALRFAKAVLYQIHDLEDSPQGVFAIWRHQLLNCVAGGDQSLARLVDTIGTGLQRAYNLYTLRHAAENGWLPTEGLDTRVAQAFADYGRDSGAQVSEFLRVHFNHLNSLGDAPRTIWERAVAAIDAIDWWKSDPGTTLSGLINDIRRIWPLQFWGIARKSKASWVNHPSLDDNAVGPEIRQALAVFSRLMHHRMLATPLYVHGQQTLMHAIFVSLQNREHRPEILWLLADASPDRDAWSFREPVIGYLARFIELILDQMNAPSAAAVPAAPDPKGSEMGMIGSSGGLDAVRRRILAFAPTDLHILISGESGTGKELAARAIHQHSAREGKSFRAVNCSQTPEALIESHLFGHVRGAFTGATTDRIGLLELSDGGTLFLDEIADIEPRIQSLLLRVIQQGEFSRVGETKIRRADIRFITATNKELIDEIRAGRFREDLFFRIAEDRILIPPLRKRFEDLPRLTSHFAKKHFPQRSVRFAKSFFGRLRGYHWPGNVRELESYIRRVLALHCEPSEILAQHALEFMMASQPQESDGESPLEALEHAFRVDVIQRRLQAFGGNRTRTAESLGLSRQRLSTLVNQLDIDSD